jgi:hypothetical protein
MTLFGSLFGPPRLCLQDNLPKPKRAAPAAKKKADVLKQAALVSERNRERMRALQPGGASAAAAQHPTNSHMGDDSDSSDDGALCSARA